MREEIKMETEIRTQKALQAAGSTYADHWLCEKSRGIILIFQLILSILLLSSAPS